MREDLRDPTSSLQQSTQNHPRLLVVCPADVVRGTDAE